jgi:RNA polymerase sigma-70 factor, ECF subfamily
MAAAFESSLTNTAAEAKAKALLDRLPERARRVLELRFLQGYSLKETAAALSTTVGNVKVLQWRALRQAAALETEDDG